MWSLFVALTMKELLTLPQVRSLFPPIIIIAQILLKLKWVRMSSWILSSSTLYYVLYSCRRWSRQALVWGKCLFISFNGYYWPTQQWTCGRVFTSFRCWGYWANDIWWGVVSLLHNIRSDQITSHHACLFREQETESPKDLGIKTEFSSSPVECDAVATLAPVEDNPYTISISVPAQDWVKNHTNPVLSFWEPTCPCPSTLWIT